MYPTEPQLALLKQCHKLWGRDNVRMTGPTERDRNVYVKCKGKAGVSRMTYAPDGTIAESILETRLALFDEPVRHPRNAIDN